jgi:hypothetical protein
LLQVLVLALEARYFIRIGFSHGIARQALLASFQKVLAPAVIQIGVDAFLTAQLCDGALAPLAIQDDANFLLSGELATGFTADILDRFFGV